MNKNAFITGVTGQDGSYLAELLLSKDYEVYGISRRKATDNGQRNLANIVNNKNFYLLSGDITDSHQINKLIREIQPNEVYHLAAMSFVSESWKSPRATIDINVNGTLNILEACKNNCLNAKIYLACSSEMFGQVIETPQTEETPFYPRSPYGVSKCSTYWLGMNYRESYDMFISNGILFNNESERRGYEFVTRKVTNYVGKLARDIHRYKILRQELPFDYPKLELGNLDAKRDWGYAPDYIRAMWKMLQQDEPDNFIIATGKQYSVRDLCKVAFNVIGENYEDYITINKKFLRPAEVHTLLGNAKKAAKTFGWVPRITFEEMITKMVENDIKLWKNKNE